MRTSIRCPTCGAAKMRRVRRSVETRSGKRCVVVPDIDVDECPKCGERLFDLEALDKIRESRTRSSRACVA